MKKGTQALIIAAILWNAVFKLIKQNKSKTVIIPVAVDMPNKSL